MPWAEIITGVVGAAAGLLVGIKLRGKAPPDGSRLRKP
jgi:hypothetical protein